MRNCDWCGKLVADKSGYVLGYKVFCCKECYEKGRERQREEEEEEREKRGKKRGSGGGRGRRG